MNGTRLLDFADRYLLAREESIKTKPEGGLAGLELEWNLLDSQFHPLLTVGAGPDQQSFVDYLRSGFITPHVRDFSQLEVFHWMIERKDVISRKAAASPATGYSKVHKHEQETLVEQAFTI